MNIIDKFYSDAKRRAAAVEFSEGRKIIADLFCKTVAVYDKQAVQLAEDFADYRLGAEISAIDEDIEWFYKIFSLIDGSFDDSMNFSEEDWEAITVIIDSAADDLDMDLLNSLMAVIVDRKKIRGR
ncbi:hypothetical protein [Treponema phagedenis]|uniref:hypothetical protein n=1 Tax=Treponema phagedenis TaxID=162 RepID=UPI0001F64015|nr:hypothetical protein [Treponema phagedenis]EFW37067.1 hypothetical protein HMPREF9554_02459 [Treponema phagedenis F0421]TYT78650.1 hypothetical protein FS559_05680 [Treponema phagedenis]